MIIDQFIRLGKMTCRIQLRCKQMRQIFQSSMSEILLYYLPSFSKTDFTKGQRKPKADWRAIDSPKKRTTEFVFFLP